MKKYRPVGIFENFLPLPKSFTSKRPLLSILIMCIIMMVAVFGLIWIFGKIDNEPVYGSLGLEIILLIVLGGTFLMGGILFLQKHRMGPIYDIVPIIDDSNIILERQSGKTEKYNILDITEFGELALRKDYMINSSTMSGFFFKVGDKESYVVTPDAPEILDYIKKLLKSNHYKIEVADNRKLWKDLPKVSLYNVIKPKRRNKK